MRRLLASRAAPLLATTLLTAIGVVLVTWPLAAVMGRATLRDGEVLLTAWQLNWFHHALLTDPASWIDANIFFPYDHATTFNDLLLSHAILTLPVAAVESPVLALNLALLGGIVLSGLFAYLLLDELVDAPWAAAAGESCSRWRRSDSCTLATCRWPRRGPSRCSSGRSFGTCDSRRGPGQRWQPPVASPSVSLRSISRVRRADRAARADLRRPPRAGRSPGVAAAAGGVRAGPGPGGVAAGAACAATLRTFGMASAPSDLIRYGADLTSLGQRPEALEQGSAVEGIDAEAHLYPGAALACLAGLGALGALLSMRTLRAWRRNVAFAGLALGGVCALGLVLPLEGPFRHAWELAVLALIWVGPVAVAAWAIAGTNTADATGPSVGIRLGLAGATLAFVLALGPQARYLARAIGPAPYWLLARASTAFEGTRVPARFGGLVLLFLAIVAAGALAALMRANARRWRIAGATATVSALLVCFVELPVPPLPKGHELLDLPALQDPVYRWLAKQPGRVGILELPDWSADADVEYWHRDWRALRYMLASKQHGQHLVNGTGRIEPFLWYRFRWVEPWSDDFFGFITAYFPVDYVLIHQAGLPDAVREAVSARLARGTDGWRLLMRSPGVHLYTIDRSFGRGATVDRLFLRRHLAPRADVEFSARRADEAGAASGDAGQAAPTLELLRDGEVIDAWPLGAEWREFRASVPVAAVPAELGSNWPRTGTLLRWRLRGTPLRPSSSGVFGRARPRAARLTGVPAGPSPSPHRNGHRLPERQPARKL
ncbi:MAG: hypothetical protein MZW92_28145 [Comamonadaceae bacterium]|nr:hypothetical protein [Comamonadaceae bacterium]